MLKYLPVLILIALTAFPLLAQKPNDTPETASVRKAVIKVGKNANVQVTRRGKPKVKGYINEIYEDSFEVISTENASTVDIPYSEVVKIKGKGIDWRGGGIQTGMIGLKAFKVMGIILKGACLGPISRCSP